MSTFTCEVIKIDDVYNHPNADRLSIIRIGGYECISARLDDGSHRYQVGDYVVYIPEASIVPDWILKQLGMWDTNNGCGILSGSGRNRVKAIKLRGVVSQGILFPVYSEGDHGAQKITTEDGNQQYVHAGDNVADMLGITKYEPAIPTQMRGVVGALYGLTKGYDIENIQKHINVFGDGEDVVFTEKLHGTLCQIGLLSVDLLKDEKQKDVCTEIAPGVYGFVTSKGLGKSGMIQQNSDQNQDNIYVRIFNLLRADGILSHIGTYIADECVAVYIFGEIFGQGVQDLDYNTPPTFRVFDVYLKFYDGSGLWVDTDELERFCDRFGLIRVPILYTGPFSMEKVIEHRDGLTTFDQKHIREGIVIRPRKERDGYRGLPDGRAQLKSVSPDYLLRKGETTEFQ